MISKYFFLIGFLISIQSIQKLEAQNKQTHIIYTDVTETDLNIYADSINNLNIAEPVLPQFMFNQCIDQDPPVFVGFHSSFRWTILQRVNNKASLQYLIENNFPLKEQMMRGCALKSSKAITYSKLSLFDLIKLRYEEL
jgi:hypothetical protein